MRYILNSAVVTTPGIYSYRLIGPTAAATWLNENGWISAIGYQETAEALEKITGHKIPVDRRQIEMKDGDEALVFRLTTRIQDTTTKGGVGRDWVLRNSEIGILLKLSPANTGST